MQQNSDPLNGLLGGSITPPPGMSQFNGNPVSAVQSLIVNGIKLFIVGAALVMLVFLLWGAFEWIISGGDKDKLQKAQQKITNAVIGFLLVFVMLAIFGVITGDILGIVKKSDNGDWQLILPSLQQPSQPSTP